MQRPVFLRSLAAAGLAAGAPSLAAAQSNTIFEVALNGRDFSTLVAAVRYAGLVELLSGKDPITLFAPSDAAFGKLPPGTVDAYLSRPDYRARLRDLLTYHIVPGSIASSALRTGFLKTLDGPDLHVTVGNPIRINDASITLADVPASNGVVHAIDAVLTPPA